MRSGSLRVVALAAFLASALATAACGGATGRGAPAAGSVRALVSALRADDARAAYDLLSADVRKQISYDEFALQWKQSKAEREWQARVLEETLRGDPDVGERARASDNDGQMGARGRVGQAGERVSARG